MESSLLQFAMSISFYIIVQQWTTTITILGSVLAFCSHPLLQPFTTTKLKSTSHSTTALNRAISLPIEEPAKETVRQNHGGQFHCWKRKWYFSVFSLQFFYKPKTTSKYIVMKNKTRRRNPYWQRMEEKAVRKEGSSLQAGRGRRGRIGKSPPGTHQSQEWFRKESCMTEKPGWEVWQGTRYLKDLKSVFSRRRGSTG